ncbi:MAG TPA: DUF6559 family protein [Thermoanaerobaculia bacterium]|nr:DUF6559 family protein [Thermoanaerobaculia bacterium]
MLSSLKNLTVSRAEKRRALQSYAKVLPRALRKEHGRRRRYTARQVRETITRRGLDPAYSPYAISMYTSALECRSSGISDEDRHEYRSEVAGLFFGGNERFTALDALELAPTGAGFGGDGAGTDVGAFGAADAGSDAGSD